MIEATYNPAVTETKLVEVAPATFTLKLNAEEMLMLTTLVGITTHGPKMYHVYCSMLECLRNAGLEDSQITRKGCVYSDEVLLKGN